jgi:hypothetical protein
VAGLAGRKPLHRRAPRDRAADAHRRGDGGAADALRGRAYLNPTTQFSLAVWRFGETFTLAHAVAFGCIWASLALYSSEALFRRPA